MLPSLLNTVRGIARGFSKYIRQRGAENLGRGNDNARCLLERKLAFVNIALDREAAVTSASDEKIKVRCQHGHLCRGRILAVDDQARLGFCKRRQAIRFRCGPYRALRGL